MEIQNRKKRKIVSKTNFGLQNNAADYQNNKNC